jgi:hypothetical protein
MFKHRLLATLVAATVLGACGADQSFTPDPSPREPAMRAASAGFGAITIVLDVTPDDPVDVHFTTEGRKLKAFTLDDNPSSPLPNSLTFTKLKPGTYTVREEQVSVGTLAGIGCVSTDARDNVITLLAHTVTIGLQAGEQVTCTFRVGWANGDLTMYHQGNWGAELGDAAALLIGHFDELYINPLEVGIPGADGFSMRFFDALALLDYLPAAGPPAPLFTDFIDPTSTISGQFGGDVVALKLNVDFSDAGLLAGNAGVAVGDLTLCGLDTLQVFQPVPQPVPNGATVSQLLATANAVLGSGGGTANFDAAEFLDFVAFRLSASFDSGIVIQWARDHLFIGACP